MLYIEETVHVNGREYLFTDTREIELKVGDIVKIGKKFEERGKGMLMAYPVRPGDTVDYVGWANIPPMRLRYDYHYQVRSMSYNRWVLWPLNKGNDLVIRLYPKSLKKPGWLMKTSFTTKKEIADLLLELP